MSENAEEKIENLILRIVTQGRNYINASYYAQHCFFPMWRNFNLAEYNLPPYFLREFCNEVKKYIDETGISTNDLITYFANVSLKNSSYFWVSQCVLKHGGGIADYNQLYNIASGAKGLPSNTVIDDEILAHAFTAFIIDCYPYDCWDFEKLVLEEDFEYPITDYRLTRIRDAHFKQDGFIFNGKYYLYNQFIDRSPLENGTSVPAIFRVLTQQRDFANADFYMRLDARLAIPSLEFDGKTRVLAAKYYGPTFSYYKTNLQRAKTFIVHGNPDSGNKLLMVIKKDFDEKTKQEFWHIELETLPFRQSNSARKRVTTTFIHGKYYPCERVFRHIDFIKNQYALDDYCQKYLGCTNAKIPVDFYTTKDCHYKVWCIENIDLSESTWYQISVLSLTSEYSILFNEMLETYL